MNDSDSDDEYHEIHFDETYLANTGTVLQSSDCGASSMTHVIAPGEGKIPVFNEQLAEYLAFPTI